MAGLLAAGDGSALGLPGLQAAVEHRHGIVARPLEHPPQAPAVVGTVAVIHHGLHAIGKAHTRQPHRKALAAGQGVASARRRLVSLLRHQGAVGSWCAVLGAQVLVQVGIYGTGNVRLRKRLRPGCGLHQLKAAIKHHQRLAAGLQGLQFCGGDKGGVGHWQRLLEWHFNVLPPGCRGQHAHAARWPRCRCPQSTPSPPIRWWESGH